MYAEALAIVLATILLLILMLPVVIVFGYMIRHRTCSTRHILMAEAVRYIGINDGPQDHVKTSVIQIGNLRPPPIRTSDEPDDIDEI